jgi:hypothetical protein
MTTASAELLACPFCGESAEIERKGDHRMSTIYACTMCGCCLETGEEWDHGRQWNTRAALTRAVQPAPDAVAEEREAIARIFDAKAAEWMLRASHPAMKKVALEWVAHHEQYAAMVRARSAAQRNPAAPRDGREK